MKKYLCPTRIVLALALIACTICVSSFRQKDSSGKHSFRTESENDEDTTSPRKRDRNADEFRMDQLDQAMKQLEKQMASLDERMKQLDLSKMQKELNASLSKINFDKMGKDVEASMKKVDWDQMEKGIKHSMEKAKKVNMEQVKAAMENAKGQFEKQKMNMHIDGEKIKENVQRAMEKAKVSMEKAREEVRNMKSFTDALEKDGLLDKSKPYRIEVKEGNLYLNGKKQSQEVSDKYRGYYKKDNFSILRNQQDDDNII